jgi:amino-acid N-acetyltransferase
MEKRGMLRIRAADAADLPAIEMMLSDNGLPTDGVAENFATFLVAETDDQLAGAIGLELFGKSALLRSAVVAAGARSIGVGGRLVTHILERARELGVTDVYLLTETAEDYFPRFGFQRMERASIPDSVRQSVEFTTCCCASAAAMHLRLSATSGGSRA